MHAKRTKLKSDNPDDITLCKSAAASSIPHKPQAEGYTRAIVNHRVECTPMKPTQPTESAYSSRRFTVSAEDRYIDRL